jgi:hypothetical protein
MTCDESALTNQANEALLSAILAALSSTEPGTSIREIAHQVPAHGPEAVRRALRQLRRAGRVRASGPRSHFLYRRAEARDDEPDADEGGAEPLPNAPAPPRPPDVTAALAFLATRGFTIARNRAEGFWVIGGQRLSPAAIVRQAEILMQPRRRR